MFLEWIDKDIIEIWSAKKSYIKIFLVILAILPFSCISCHKPIQNVTKQVLTLNKPISIPVAPIGKRTVIKIIKENDKLIEQITYKTDFGWKNKFGIYGTLDSNLGLSYAGPFIWRVEADGLVGRKGAGLGLSFQIMSNTNIGVSYDITYETLLFQPRAFVKVNL